MTLPTHVSICSSLFHIKKVNICSSAIWMIFGTMCVGFENIVPFNPTEKRLAYAPDCLGWSKPRSADGHIAVGLRFFFSFINDNFIRKVLPSSRTSQNNYYALYCRHGTSILTKKYYKTCTFRIEFCWWTIPMKRYVSTSSVAWVNHAVKPKWYNLARSLYFCLTIL